MSAALNPVGQWREGITYNEDDCVSFGGRSYRAMIQTKQVPTGWQWEPMDEAPERRDGGYTPSPAPRMTNFTRTDFDVLMRAWEPWFDLITNLERRIDELEARLQGK